MDATAKTLMEMYRAMRGHFGHQGWWPGEGKLEICVGAILTQNTNWTNVEKAIANLRAAGCLSAEALHALDHAALAALIRPAGYYNLKARRLKNFIACLHADWADDIEGFLNRPLSALREDLLGMNGIGRETADSIILYAAGRSTFVVDAYTARILLRHQLIWTEADYDEIKHFFESSLPDDAELFKDFHAQLVAVGKRFCRPRARCAGCPLEGFAHDAEATATG